MTRAEITKPAVWVGFTAFGALLLATFIGVQFTPYLAIFCLLLGVVLLLRRYHKREPAAVLFLFTAAFFFGLYSVCYLTFVSPFAQYAGEKYTVRAEILSEAEQNSGNFYYKARITYVEDLTLDTNFTIRLSHGESLDADIGDTVSCTVKFFDYEDKVGLSSKTSRLAEGAVLGGYIADYENIAVEPAESRSLRYHLAALRAYMRARIEAAFPRDEASVLAAMLLGFRSEIPDDLNSSYKGAGATHILVISGMHMAIVAQFALEALRRIGLRRRIAAAITIPIILAFMAVSGFSASVLRSGIMQIIFLLGILLGRKPDALNSLAIAAGLILLFRPFWIGDVSFLLSFSSTLGIITLNPRLMAACTGYFKSEKTQRIAVRVLSPVVTSVSAIIGSLPVQLYVFGTINPASVITSLLILEVSAWIIRLGLPTVVLLSIPTLRVTASPLVLVCGLLIRLQNFITAWVSGNLPGAARISGAYLRGTVLIIVLFLLIVFAVHRGKKLPLAAFALSAVLLLVGTAADALTTYDRTKLLVFHSSYAECTAILRDDRAVVLSCSGSSATVGNFLAGHGTREIEALFIGEKESSIRCAEDLYESFRTDRIILPDTVYFRTDTTAEVYHYGTTSELEDDLTVNISAKGDYAAFTVNGTSIIFEQSDAGYTPETCDIAIADDPDSFARGELTLLLTEDDLLTAAPELTAGQYILTSEHEAVCLLIGRDGSYTIENG